MNTPTPPQSPGQQLLTVTEVAERLRVGKNFVYNRINSGELGHVTIKGGKSSRKRVTEEQLAAYIDYNGDQIAQEAGTVTPTE